MKNTLKIALIFLISTSFQLKSNAQRTVTYKTFLIKKSIDKTEWENVPFANCIIVQDLDKLTTTIYKGSIKLIYAGYDVDLPTSDPKIGTTYISKCIDNEGKECVLQQIIWNGNLMGTSTIYINYPSLSISYDADIISHSN